VWMNLLIDICRSWGRVMHGLIDYVLSVSFEEPRRILITQGKKKVLRNMAYEMNINISNGAIRKCNNMMR